MLERAFMSSRLKLPLLRTDGALSSATRTGVEGCVKPVFEGLRIELPFSHRNAAQRASSRRTLFLLQFFQIFHQLLPQISGQPQSRPRLLSVPLLDRNLGWQPQSKSKVAILTSPHLCKSYTSRSPDTLRSRPQTCPLHRLQDCRICPPAMLFFQNQVDSSDPKHESSLLFPLLQRPLVH